MVEVIGTNMHGRPQKRARRTTAISEAKRKRFIDVLSATCNVRTAAAAVKVSARSLYRVRNADAAFAATWQEALTIGYDRLEQALVVHALGMVEAPQEGADPDAGDAALRAASGDGAAADGTEPDAERAVRSASGKLKGAVGVAELRFVLDLIERAKANARGPRRTCRQRPSAEEVDAAINRKLDALAKRLGLPA